MLCPKTGNLIIMIISVGFSCDFTHWSMYTCLTFFTENQFLNWLNVFSGVHHTLYPAVLPPLLWVCGTDFPCVRTQARQTPGFVRKLSSEFPFLSPLPFFCLSSLIKMLSLVESTVIFMHDDVIMTSSVDWKNYAIMPETAVFSIKNSTINNSANFQKFLTKFCAVIGKLFLYGLLINHLCVCVCIQHYFL